MIALDYTFLATVIFRRTMNSTQRIVLFLRRKGVATHWAGNRKSLFKYRYHEKSISQLEGPKLGDKMVTEDLEIITTYSGRNLPKTEQELDNLMIDSSLAIL
jgi:hypothetical protein